MIPTTQCCPQRATELALLSVGHATNILNRFVTGRIPAVEVENWANAVEGRDDIGFDSAEENGIGVRS
jgi:hypothetical protein